LRVWQQPDPRLPAVGELDTRRFQDPLKRLDRRLLNAAASLWKAPAPSRRSQKAD
jgi:hypothetical protein